jgi:hypothetical protein
MSENAKFEDHISHVCLKVKQTCGWILRTFGSRNSHLMNVLWKSLIQDHTYQLTIKVSEMQQIATAEMVYQANSRTKMAHLLEKTEAP